MPIANGQGWAKWLNDHASRATYDRYPERVAKLLSDSGSPEVKFERIARNKNLLKQRQVLVFLLFSFVPQIAQKKVDKRLGPALRDFS